MKKGLSVAFKLLIIIGGIFGVFLSLKSSLNIATMLSFYTIQSNILCVILFMSIVFLLLFNKSLDKKEYYLIKGACTMCILTTFIVYHFILTSHISLFDINFKELGNTLVHYFVPLMTVLDYIIFDKKGNYKWFYPFLWMIIPLLYPLYVFIYNFFGGLYITNSGASKVPYFFLDYEKIGLLKVFRWIALIVAGYLMISYCFVMFDGLCKYIYEKSNKMKSLTAATVKQAK